MVSRFTKAMPQRSTAKLSQLLGPLDTTDSVLQACANTRNSRVKLALNCEVRVLEYFLKHNFSLLYHRKKLFGVEVDLIFTNHTGAILLVEVKSNRSGWSLTERLSKNQIDRLCRVRLKLQDFLRAGVQAHVVLVAQELEVFSLSDLL